MSLYVETTIEIDATARRVWSVLMDFEAYPEWNPFVRGIQGSAMAGQRLRVSICPPSGRSMRFRPQLLTVNRERELRWRGSLVVPGLFDGEHCFKLEPISASRTRFTQGESFSGLLVALFENRLQGPTRQGFEQMNLALKLRTESLGPDERVKGCRRENPSLTVAGTATAWDSRALPHP